MEIKKNTLIKNKTYNYLLPCLKYYGKEDFNKFKSFLILGAGINDMNIYVKNNNCIFLLYNLSPGLPYAEQKAYYLSFAEFLDTIRTKSYYVNDYLFNCSTHNAHMVVIKIPDEHEDSFQEFIAGNYSKMYSKECIYKYFEDFTIPNNLEAETRINNNLDKIRKILMKHSSVKEEFVDAVNSRFDTNIKVNEFNGELDYPIKLEEEIFNY